jgi:general secretion pathway protein M
MKLARREKYLISVAAFCIAIFFFLQFLIFPFFESKRRKATGLTSKEKAIQEMMRLKAEYQTYERGSDEIQQALVKRDKGFTLFSFLEEAAGKAEVKGNIKYMKPSATSESGPYKESMVEMKLEGVTLEQLMRYLYRVESPEDLVSIRRISINEDQKEQGYLDAIVQVLTFQ